MTERSAEFGSRTRSVPDIEGGSRVDDTHFALRLESTERLG